MDLFKLLGTIAVDNSEAKKALQETQSAAKETAESIENTGDSGNGAGSKLGAFFGGVGKGAVTCAKVVGAGIAAASGVVAGFVTKSVQSYADYEQLVGGVETLFKDSAYKIQDYADAAYKTAGLSANEYMETVTSFSASLLQSLGGDTDAAAEKANLAIIDMSDNANKMGTDMSLIQNAYQGFAKANYTMLDNLKLGYGGTKEEMARLLADAQAISGIEYDISSYADIVDAIHVIQTEMGITGTTAKEASSTISGSIGAMKSSWQNLLTALSGDGWDVGVFVANFVDAATTVTENLIPRIQIALEGVVSLIDSIAPIIIEKVPGLISTLLPVLINAATSILNSLVSAMPELLNALLACIPDVINAITTIFNAIVTALPTLMQAIVSALPTLLPALIDGLISMILTLVTNFVQIIQPIIDYLPEIIVSIVNALMNNLPALIDGIIALVMGIVGALPQIILGLVNAIPTIITTIVDALLKAIPQLIEGAIQIVTGLVVALPEIINGLITALPSILQTVWDAIVDFFKGLPEWFGQLWDGVKDITSKAWDGIKSVTNTAVSTIKSKYDEMKEAVTQKVETMRESATKKFNEIKDVAKEKFNAAKDAVKKAMQDSEGSAKASLSAMKKAYQDNGGGIKGIVSATMEGVKGFFRTGFDFINSLTKGKFGEIVNSIKSKMNSARDIVKGIIDKIKGFFNFTVSLPKIKLPHFSIKPSGWKIGDLLEGSIPKLGIDWYAKAMRNPMIMSEPTVFGYNAATGRLQGGGESGSEVVSGTNTLMNMIGAVVEAKTGVQMERMVALLTALLEAIVTGNKELLAAVLSGQVIQVDGREFGRTVREYA